jgi:hypothetical protein
MNEPLPLGTKTKWGKIGMIGITGGERYYWMTSWDGPVASVAMIPAFIVESEHEKEQSD